MFQPKECFKAALVCPVIAYVTEAVVWHHHGRGLLVFAAFFGAVPLLFGLFGLRG